MKNNFFISCLLLSLVYTLINVILIDRAMAVQSSEKRIFRVYTNTAMPIAPVRNILRSLNKASNIILVSIESSNDLGYGEIAIKDKQHNVHKEHIRMFIKSIIKGTVFKEKTEVEMEIYDYSVNLGEQYVLFLDENGDYLDIDYPIIPIDARISELPKGLSVMDAINKVIVDSIKPDTPFDIFKSCINCAIDINATEAVKNILPFLNSRDIQVESYALKGLVRLQYRPSYQRAVDFILRNANYLSISSMVYSAINNCKDLEISKYVSPLLSSENAEIRSAALQVMRRSKDVNNIPYFIKALSDEDFYNRYDAMMGLSASLPDKQDINWSCSIPIFKENENLYINKWLDWWENKGKQKYNSK